LHTLLHVIVARCCVLLGFVAFICTGIVLPFRFIVNNFLIINFRFFVKKAEEYCFEFLHRV